MLYLWFPSAHAYSLEEHRVITQQAFDNLQTCGISVPVSEQKKIITENIQEDTNLIVKWGKYSHYYHPERSLGLRRLSSLDRIRDLAEPTEHLGVVTHHLQDLTLPLHVLPISHNWNDGLESLTVVMPHASVDCESIEHLSHLPFTEQVQQTAEDTLKFVRTGSVSSVDSTQIPLSVFWQESDAQYGAYDRHNTFGQSNVQWENKTYTVRPESYIHVKQRLLVRAVQHTTVALYTHFSQVSAMPTTLIRESHDSVLQEMRDRGISQPDFPTQFLAIEPSPSAIPFKVCEAFDFAERSSMGAPYG